MPHGTINNHMKTEALQDVNKHCASCIAMQIDTSNNDAKGSMRYRCMHCKKGNQGIYKFDAIYTAIQTFKELEQAKEENKELKAELQRLKEIEQKYQELKEKQEKQKSNLTPGRKPTAEKQYGKIIRNLRAEGKTLREINKMTGISINTIQKCLQPGKDKK